MITIEIANDSPARYVEAVREANLLLQGDELYDTISARTEPFDNTDPSDLLPETVADALRGLNLTFTVETKRFDKPSTTGSYTSRPGNCYTTMYLSDRSTHTDNPVSVVVGTLIHECVHALDCFDKDFKIKHKGNSRKGNENTAPYWIGDTAADMIGGAGFVDLTYEVELQIEE